MTIEISKYMYFYNINLFQSIFGHDHYDFFSVSPSMVRLQRVAFY